MREHCVPADQNDREGNNRGRIGGYDTSQPDAPFRTLGREQLVVFSPLLRIVEDLIGADDLLKPVTRVRFARIQIGMGCLYSIAVGDSKCVVVGVRPNAKQLVKCPWGAGMFPDSHERITM